jgi:membrane-associated protease RseP (regulator of RpoE activity)
MLFWILIYVLSRALNLKKYGLNVEPLYLIYRTKRFNNTLDKIAIKFRRFWLVVLNIGVIFAFGLMAYAIYIITINLANFIWMPPKAAPVLPLVPLVTIGIESLPYFAVAFTIIILTHEGAHSIASRLGNVEIKSSGILFLFVLFGAFVEPDKEQLEKSKLAPQTRVYAAGSLANLTVAFLAIILIMNFSLMISPFYSPNSSGVIVTQVEVGEPAYNAGIQANDVINKLNSTPITTVEQFTGYMSKVNPGNLLKLSVLFHNGTSETVNVITTPLSSNPGHAIVGINIFDYYAPKAGWLPRQGPLYTYLQLSWIWLLAINVAILNMLPLYPLDGDKFLFSIVERFKRGAGSKIRLLTSALLLTILASNVILTVFRLGITQI